MTSAPSIAAPTFTIHGDLWVFNKPSGMPSHITGNPDRLDLVNWAVNAGHAPKGLAPIHRLDAGTSGVVLASPNPELRSRLCQFFAQRTVQKVYRTLVYGTTPEDGRITKLLRDQRRGAPVAAETHYESLAWLKRSSYLEVRPRTGRKHQIRKHMQGIRHPIVGDVRYKLPARQRVPQAPNRLWLHALSLSLPDGRIFEAPLAAELQAHLATIGLSGDRSAGRFGE